MGVLVLEKFFCDQTSVASLPTSSLFSVTKATATVKGALNFSWIQPIASNNIGDTDLILKHIYTTFTDVTPSLTDAYLDLQFLGDGYSNALQDNSAINLTNTSINLQWQYNGTNCQHLPLHLRIGRVPRLGTTVNLTLNAKFFTAVFSATPKTIPSKLTLIFEYDDSNRN